MTRAKRAVIIVGFPLLAFMAASTALRGQAKWKGTIVKDGDVTVIKNPKKPLYPTPVLELKEELSLGGAEAQGDYAFGQIRGLTVDDAGAIYVLDYKDSHVKVFDAEGRLIGRIPLKRSGGEILKGKYYALEEDDEGYQLVKRYAVTWAVK